MKKSDLNKSRPKHFNDGSVKSEVRSEEFALMLDKYSEAQAKLLKELEYGRQVRGKMRKLKTDLSEAREVHLKVSELARKQKIRLESLEKKVSNLQNQMESTRNTLSFRLGYALIHGFKSWGDFVRLPGILFSIRQDARARKQQKTDKRVPVTSALPVSSEAQAIPLNLQTESVNNTVDSGKHDLLPANEATSVSQHESTVRHVVPQPTPESLAGVLPISDTGEVVLTPAVSSLVDERAAEFKYSIEDSQANVPAETTSSNIDTIDARLESLVGDLKNLKMACIMDEFTFHSFQSECKLFQIHPETWKEELIANKPDLLFLESAWKGIDESWAKKISDISSEAIELMEYCKENEIPIVFWNKEDPFHFGRFLPIAKRADLVFTTDVDCIEKYKHEVGHDRVYLLPFAAQPSTHNPIENFERKDGFSFAGSFYLRYPERQRDFDNIYEVAQELKSVDIYDRNFENPHPHLKFPEKYDASIVGCLPVSEIDKAYKGYKFGINMNTIKYSQTMFARRVYELMASNTIVVSNFSRGLRTLFGDLVISSDARPELHRRLKQLCEDETYYRKFRLLGLRKVLKEHTYSHRLAFILSKITNKELALPQPKIAMVGFAKNQTELDLLISTFQRQTYVAKKLYVVTDSTTQLVSSDLDVHIFFDVNELIPKLKLEREEFVAPLCSADYYGMNYLTDLVLAKKFGEFDAVGKAAYYLCSNEGATSLINDGSQYKRTDSLDLRSSLLTTSAFEKCEIRTGDSILHRKMTGHLFCMDEFNYCRQIDDESFDLIAAIVDDIQLDNTGLNLEQTVYKIVDTIKPSVRGVVAESAEKLPGISAKELHAILPKKLANTLKFNLVDSKLTVKSTLADDQHKYIYLTKQFTRSELNFETNNRFQLLCDGDVNGDVRTIYVFLDDKGEKIEHAMNKVGAAYSITIPKNCHLIKLGFRFQGPGEVRFERLILGDLREKPSVLLSNSTNLVLTKQYPDYSDLYKYGFLHSRIKEYKKQNLDFEVFKVSEHVNIEYREFEGIDILSSDYEFLDNLLQQGTVKKIIVHFIDNKIWNVLRNYLNKISIYIWIHGAEIQPWYRRAVRFDSTSALQKARKASDVAQEMWLDIFEHVGEQLRLVFVSQYLADEVQNDFGCHLDRRFYSVIPNYINNQIFSYIEKPPESRKRILSIRPYASAIYGNDLAVKAVEQLSREPFFNDLQFKFVGDGPLFDETVESIKNFSNVTLQKGFVTQAEIASLHKDYGIFLVPSRMDTQGVSRDEAMSSGLVPITTRVAAIPDFVDESCAVLAAPENSFELAQGIKDLYQNSDRFMEMSRSASLHVRGLSGYGETISREIQLIRNSHLAGNEQKNDPGRKKHIALYGDVNLNLTDGSAIWAISLAETLAGIDDVYVTVFLKCRIKQTHIISPLFNLSRKVRIVEPKIEDGSFLTPQEALQKIEAEESFTPFDGIILRGLNLCHEAVSFGSLRHKIWSYITDLPQQRKDISPPVFNKVSTIFSSAKFVLCQTPQFKQFVEENFPQTSGKAKILGPMIPHVLSDSVDLFSKLSGDTPLRIVYAGKFAPMWGIREMFATFTTLRQRNCNVELHIFGDKIHNPPDDPSFKKQVTEWLTQTEGVTWYKAVPRETVLSALPSMHIGWAFRDKNLEQNTKELSTKILEYAAMGLPVLLARNSINEEVFGATYDLFVDDAESAVNTLERYCFDKSRLESLINHVLHVSEMFTFESVRKQLLEQHLV